MSKKDIKKRNSAVKKSSKKSDDDKKKKRKNAFFIFFTFLGSAALAALGVMGVMYGIKSCNKKPTEDERITVYINQLEETSGWVLKVNDCTDIVKVNKGDELKAVISPQEMAKIKASLKQTNDGFDPEFFIRITDHASPEKTLSEIKLLKQEDESYVADFIMRWDYEIDVSAFGKESTEAYVYTVDKDEEGKVKKTWRYDEKSLVTADSPIIRDSDKGDHEEIARNIFNEEIYVGNKVKWMEDSFLNHCTALNKQVHLETADALNEISGDFMMGCTSYNQPLVFNDSLRIIGLGFLSNCTSFNQPLDFNKVEQLTGDTQYDVFMYQCTSFNSSLSFGTNMKWIPNNFMVLCTSFNQPITIPSTVTNIGSNFMFSCPEMVSPVTIECPITSFIGDYGTFSVGEEHKEKPIYAQGLPIYVKSEEDKTAFRTKFPDLPVSSITEWYRKLLIEVKL